MAVDRQFPTGCRRKTWPALLLSLIGLVLAHPATAAGTTRFVAPDGNDAWSGTRAKPDATRTDGPFATLRRAQEAVRESRTRTAPERVATVAIRGGTYPLRAPLVFRPEDSGSGDVPVVWEAAPGERPVLSGGRTIAGWKRGAGPLWTAEIAEVKTGGWSFRQLFVNGQRRPRARLPEKGIRTLAAPAKVDATLWAGTAPPASEWDRWSFQYKPGDIDRRWRNLDDVEVVVLQYWMEARLRIKAVDERNHVVLFTGGSWRPLTWSGGYYVENVFEGLGTPGSWYLDRKQGVVYYHPLPDEDMSRAAVVAPVLEQLVRLEGDAAAGRFVKNLTFRGLGFQHTDWRLGPQGYACEQAELPPAAAFLADGATGCRVERCDFTHLGGWGIEFRRGCRDGVVSHATMSDLGAGCVKIGEPKNAASDVEETRQTVVSDNHFHDAGLVYLGSPAVWIGQSSGNVVSHNDISGPVMWAISAGWTWSYFPLQRARDNVIEWNHCHHIGTGPLGAHCAIYALGTSPGTVIRNNYVHHVQSSPFWTGAAEGIILDNGCAGILVENNVVHDAVAGGFGTNFNGFGNIIVNNIFAYGSQYQLTVYGDPPTGRPQPKGEVFARNIVVWTEGPLIREADWPGFSTLWDYNLYWQDEGKPVRFMKYSFDQWKAKDLDIHSAIADPHFVDAKGRDFRLEAGSPALGLGFRPIDLSTVGPRK